MFARAFAGEVLAQNRHSLNSHPDYFEIEPDGNSIKIEQIRNMLKTVYEKPVMAKRKVYIINNSERMTKEAQNSLLKTLEEPPTYVCIILVSSNDNLFLNTIKSRCIKIAFNRLTDEELKSVANISDDLIKIADGSIAKAMEFEEKREMFIAINNVFNDLERIDAIDFINSKDEIFKEYVKHNSSVRIENATSEKKEDAQNVLEYISLIFFEKLRTSKEEKYAKCI
ncbi:MAG: hypothetical protein FWC68_06470, partial [Oscillospiraceae bacterium]|nr:hypothetical protein [Oscillospiraceae bacterium]